MTKEVSNLIGTHSCLYFDLLIVELFSAITYLILRIDRSRLNKSLESDLTFTINNNVNHLRNIKNDWSI